MATLRMFGGAPGLLSVNPNTYTNYFIVEGGPPSVSVGLYRDIHPPQANDDTLDESMSQTIPLNSSGNGVLALSYAAYTDGVSPPYDWYAHSPNNALVTSRIATLPGFTIVNHHPYPSAVTVGGLIGAPGNASAVLKWDVGVALDAASPPLLYRVQRSTTSSTVGFGNATGLISPTFFVDTGLTNGTTYWYRVLVFAQLYGASIGDFLVGGAGNRSNVVSLVPQTVKESWGVLAA